MEASLIVNSEHSYSIEASALVLKSKITVDTDDLQAMFGDYLYGRCPTCFSLQFNDGDIVCDECYELATEEREKYR